MCNPRRKVEGSRSQHEPSAKHCDVSQPVYATREATELLIKEFPSWHPSDVLTILQTVYQLAQGGSGCTTLHLFGHGQMTFHFDGVGGMMMDPSSTCSPKTQEIARGLRWAFDEKFCVGRPEGGDRA